MQRGFRIPSVLPVVCLCLLALPVVSVPALAPGASVHMAPNIGGFVGGGLVLRRLGLLGVAGYRLRIGHGAAEACARTRQTGSGRSPRPTRRACAAA